MPLRSAPGQRLNIGCRELVGKTCIVVGAESKDNLRVNIPRLEPLVQIVIERAKRRSQHMFCRNNLIAVRISLATQR